jgi:hypothetical protein
MKISKILITVLVLAVTLSACAATGLAGIFDQDAVIARGEEIVELVNAQDFESVNAEFRADLRDQLTSNQLKDALGQKVVDAGSFVDFQSITTLGQKSKSTGEDYATVVLVGNYQNGTLVFTVTMDANLDLVGFYIK